MLLAQMLSTRKAAVLAILLGCLSALPFPARAGPIFSVTSSVSLSAPGYVADSGFVDEFFTLLVTGGSGSGWFTPLMTVQGTDNSGADGEGQDGLTAYGHAMASFGGISISAPTEGGDYSNATSVYDPADALPFTFGVPENFELLLSSDATMYTYIESSGQTWMVFPVNGGTNAALLGLGGFKGGGISPADPSNVSYTSATYTLTEDEAPEPSACVLIALGLAALLLLRRRVLRTCRRPSGA
jgi:hypothetical protein